MNRRLEGRIAVVTGAAGGLGLAAARRLAREGARIEILDLKDGSAAVNEILAEGGDAYATLCDCANEAQIASAVEGISKRRGAADILVNNAGILSGRKPAPGAQPVMPPGAKPEGAPGLLGKAGQLFGRKG